MSTETFTWGIKKGSKKVSLDKGDGYIGARSYTICKMGSFQFENNKRISFIEGFGNEIYLSLIL